MLNCTRCRLEFTPELKRNNTSYKTCKKCREKYKASRNRNKCEHGKRRSTCKECGGASICEHGRQRSLCKECGGASICEHGRRRNRCKECGGSSICEHGRLRSQCKECDGTSICKHNQRRSRCRECQGSSFCEHSMRRTRCKKCGGSSLCKHDRLRMQCKECKGSSICYHDKRRSQCIICTPKRACQHCLAVYVSPYSNFRPYCFTCYCVLNPDVEIKRKYKLKEHHLRDFLKSEFKEVSMIFDKACGKSGRRPDVLIDCKTYCIVIECDENQHKSYENCENRRCMEIFADLKNRPLVVLRFNPDTYIDSSGKKVQGCFTTTKTVGFKVNKKEWEKRMGVLTEKIWFYKKNSPEKDFTVEYLFYDE